MENIRLVIRKMLKESLEQVQRPIQKIRDIADNISVGLGANNGPDEGQIKDIIPYLTTKEICEMYECAGSKGKRMSMSGGFGGSKKSGISNDDFNGFKKDMKCGDELFKMGLAHYHSTEKQKTVDGEVECEIGWYLTNAGKKVISQIIDEIYTPYVLKEIHKNPYLKKIVERASPLGSNEFIISLKQGEVPFSFWFYSDTKKIANISTNGMNEMVDDIKQIERSIKFLREVVDNTFKLQKEFKKVNLVSFKEIYKKTTDNN